MMQQSPFIIRLALLALVASLRLPSHAIAALPAVGQVVQDQRKICAEPIRQSEREAGIPSQLLAAVALAESGRWDKTDSANFAWPWTVTAEGKGQFFATKAEAIAHVQRLRARGLRNIDVGCMQINLLHHPNAFASLEEALDPQANVAYATGFLKQLFEKHRSWIVAVGNYHSATPEFHMRYRQKVTKLWNDERRRDAEARRQETIAAYQQRRQQAIARKEQQRESAAGADDPSNADATEFAVADSQLSPYRDTAPAMDTQRPQLPSRPSTAPAPSASLRVMTQIPTNVPPRPGASAPMPQPSNASRVQPRTTLVPLERRF